MKKPYKIALYSLLIIVVIVASTAATGYYFLASRQISLDKDEYIFIDKSDSTESVVAKIVEIVQPRNVTAFRWLSGYYDYDKYIKTGKFAIKDGDSMLSLFKRLIRGEQTPVRVVIPSVRTINDLAESIDKQLMLDSTELMDIFSNHAYISRLDYTFETFPTLFIPNTYEMYWNTDINKFMARILKENHRFWNDKRKERAAALGLTPVEVSTLASIVDEETNHAPEKPIVAGLYLNRLKRGIPLQADPTVKFALQDFGKRRILTADLQTDSPYNTYKHKGLPPGPIRIPSIEGIESVLNAAQHNYLYMCAKEDFSGSHNFASTLSAHNANARRYQQALNKLNIKK